jgi:ribosomal protein L7/L12
MATIIIAIVAISAVLSILVALNQVSQRVEAANESLRNISKHLGVHDNILHDLEEELRVLMKQGKKIEALRLYRKTTGLSLKEAHAHIAELNLGENDEGVSGKN